MAADGRVLSSKWDGLSEHLRASICAVDRTGATLSGSNTVQGPITDCTIESTANWQSPFEQSGPDSRAPAIMAILQSGVIESYLKKPLEKLPVGNGVVGDLLDRVRSAGGSVNEFSREAAGRSSMTKINSTQIFTGAPPIRITMTMHFRAFANANAEVREPTDQLMQWHLSRGLSENGSVVSLFTGDGIGRLLPSAAPVTVSFRFGGYLVAPMVIESASMPLTVPRTSAGDPLHVQMQLTLSTMTAMDATDWTRARGGKPIKLFNNK